MPYTSEYDADNRYVIHRLNGKVTFQRARAALERLLAETPADNVIWDLREADLSEIVTADIRAITAALKPRIELRAGAKTAWVTDKPADFGICRMAQAHLDALPYPKRVFRSLPEARAWILGEEPD